MMRDWNHHYAAAEYAVQSPLALIERLARDHSPGSALDLACGTGRHALCLARRGWRVTAVDSSEIAIQLLRRAAGEQGLDIHAYVCDLERPGFRIEPGGYDLICDCLYLQRSLLAPIRDGVRPGGLAVLALPMVDPTPGIPPMNPAYLVEADEVHRWFEDWEILECAEQGSEPGRRKLAQLIARRPLPPRADRDRH